MKNRAIMLLATAFMWLNASSVTAQTPAATTDATPDRTELTVIDVENLSVDVLAGTLLNLLPNDSSFSVIGEATTNKLILHGPKDKMPTVLDLIRELDRPQRMITVNVIEVAVAPEAEDEIRTAETSKVQQTIEQTAKQGWLKVIDRMHFSVADKTTAEVQVGRQAPVLTGRQFRGGPPVQGRGGAAANSYSYSQMGTIFQATPRAGENAVFLDFMFEKSELVPPADDSEAPASIVTTKAKSTVRILKDQSVVFGGMRMGPDDKVVRWRLIISATVD